MDPELLAAYVAGELDADERARIEAALARDPALRTEAERLEVAERALDLLSPARPTDGFEQRLREAVAPALAETLDASESREHAASADERASGAGAWTAGGDELATRRAPGRWVTAAIGAAAGVALLGVAGVALLGLPGGDDAGEQSAMESVDDAGEGALGGADAGGPVILATGRDLDDAAELLDEPTLERLRDEGLDLAAGGELARAYTRQLHGPASRLGQDETAPRLEAEADADADADADGGELDATEETSDAESPESPAGDGQAETARGDEEAVARCLDVLLEGAGDPPPIPAYVELLRYDDEPAIAYGMLTPGGSGSAYDRIEVWVVDRAGCQVRELRQDGG